MRKSSEGSGPFIIEGRANRIIMFIWVRIGKKEC